jgi:sugar lactone lactonase YvrE
MSSVVVDILRELVFRNRDRHANPVLDGPMRPNSRLEECPVVCQDLSEPDDVAIASDGAAYVTAGRSLFRFSDANFTDGREAMKFAGLATGVTARPQGGVAVCVAGQGIALIGGPEGDQHIPVENLKCPTAICAADDGSLYVCDGSADNSPDRWAFDLMEKRRSGRVLRISPGTGSAEVLADRLAYPNGVCLSPDGSLIVTEAWSHRILNIAARGTTGVVRRRPETVARNLPGYPARIIPFGSGYCLTVFALRTQLVDFVLTEDGFRQRMIERVEPEFWIAPTLRARGHYLEPVQGGGLRKHGSVKAWAPPRSYGLVVLLDGAFEPELSLHSRVGGSCHGVTGVAADDGDLIVVSKGHEKILRIPGNTIQ